MLAWSRQTSTLLSTGPEGPRRGDYIGPARVGVYHGGRTGMLDSRWNFFRPGTLPLVVLSYKRLQRGSAECLRRSRRTTESCFQSVTRLETRRPPHPDPPHFPPPSPKRNHFKKLVALACSRLTKVKDRSRALSDRETLATTKYWKSHSLTVASSCSASTSRSIHPSGCRGYRERRARG